MVTLSSSNPRNAERRPAQRLAGLEWLRAIAAVLVLMLHTGIPYLTHSLPGLIWATESSEKSRVVNALCWGIDGFIMPLFFLLSGYFAAQLFAQKGSTEFLKHRCRRIGVPFLLAAIILLPIDLYLWVLGWIGAEVVPWSTLWRLSFPEHLDEALWGLAHLWYLAYLLLFCVAASIISFVVHAMTSITSGRGKLVSPDATIWGKLPAVSGVPMLAFASLIAGFVLWWQPRIVIGFRNYPLPLWENMTFYAIPFFLGWCWKRQEFSFTRRLGGCSAKWLFVAAVFLGVLLVPQLKWHLQNESQPAQAFLPPFLFASFGLVFSAALFKLALSVNLKTVPVSVRYLANASFVVYLVHHPLSALFNIDFGLVHWPPFLEFVLSTVGVLTLSLLMYEVGVRRTWLGLLLNGFQEPAIRKAAPPVSAESELRAAG